MKRSYHIILLTCISGLVLTTGLNASAYTETTPTDLRTTLNWAVSVAGLLFVIALGIYYRDKSIVARHRLNITNPEHDHSTRQYRSNTNVHPSAIVPATAFTPENFLGLNRAGTMLTNKGQERYLFYVRWMANIGGGLRVFTYIPTMLTLWISTESGQYSLITWFAWIFANVTLTLSIYEQNGRKVDDWVFVNICNVIMCVCTTALIVYLR